MTPDSQPYHAAEVIITTNNGEKFSSYNAVDLGRGLSNPMRDDELWEKFEDCALRTLQYDAIKPLFERLQNLENERNLKEITSLMLHPATKSQSATVE